MCSFWKIFTVSASGTLCLLDTLERSRRRHNAHVYSVSTIESDAVDTRIDAEKTTLFIVQSGALGVESPSI